MTKTHEKAPREPLFHVVKRAALPWWHAWLIRAVAVLLALLFCGVLSYLLTKQNPIEIYKTMWDGAFGTTRRIWGLCQNIAILLCLALAVTPAFRMRFWNIGAEGRRWSAVLRRLPA